MPPAALVVGGLLFSYVNSLYNKRVGGLSSAALFTLSGTKLVFLSREIKHFVGKSNQY